jgi:transcriptional regulator with XRE-family HTH domain
MEIKYFDTYDAIIKEFGRRIKDERLSQNIKRESLSEQTGVSISTIDRIEKGEDVKFSNIIRILQGLGLVENLNLIIKEYHVDLKKMFDNQTQRKRARSKKNQENEWIWGEDK